MKQHGVHSGYDLLFRHMGLQPANSAWGTRLADAIPVGLAWRLWQLRPQATAAAGLRAELGAMPWLARGRGHLCHFIYGEDTYFFTPLWQRKGNHSIASFHYPPQRLAMRVNPGSLQALHAVIILGDNQRPYFEQLLPADRIHYCPHAVDTEFFCPAPAEKTRASGPLRLLCAGTVFRDYGALREVHRLVRRAGFAVETDVVGVNAEQAALLQEESGIHVHKGVSDEALRSLYRSTTVGVLPLTDSTANNALLEMMACGVPVVSTAVGAVPQYCEGSAVRLVPPADAQALADAVCSLLDDDAARAQAGAANRRHAECRYGLDVVAGLMRAVYERCAMMLDGD
jgi:glycosyltransferase involved in cell wall biosynthesis